jgi:arabinan endo-1,5-alpha-L-arabinosidase
MSRTGNGATLRPWPQVTRPIALAVALALSVLAAPAAPSAADAASATYRNPVNVVIPAGGSVESCADPTVIRGQTAADSPYWYMYCTTDPLNGDDRDAGGNFNFHLIPMLRSADLVNWTYMGDAFAARPTWVAANAGLWAPEIQFFNGQYYLYYTASDTSLPGGGSAIGVATSASPLGPWTDRGTPAVEPHEADCCEGSRRWVFDPDVIEVAGQRYIYYGSYFGGISVRELSADGLTSDPATQTNVAISNRYEGAEVVERGGYFYLFGSATDCCRGPLTGYSVFVGRSTSPTGPFEDRDGASFLDGRVGGTPALTMNGNRWVGTGHNSVFQDLAGEWWTFYHAVDQNDPYFEGAVGFTKRPVLLDPVDWTGGWPEVRGGAWASDQPMKRPAAQPGDKSGYKTAKALRHTAGNLIDGDEFNSTSLGDGWTWVREPGSGTSISGGAFHFDTQAADLFVESNNASLLNRALPADGNWVAETRVRINLPPEGCCFNFVQAGMVVYGGDDNYLKLVHVSIWETRQTEWAKELYPVPAGFPRYGNTVVSSPVDWTYLRIARWETDEAVHYQAYTSHDGATWTAGGVWNHDLGVPTIGLVSMGGSGFTADFDYLRIHQLKKAGSGP